MFENNLLYDLPIDLQENIGLKVSLLELNDHKEKMNEILEEYEHKLFVKRHLDYERLLIDKYIQHVFLIDDDYVTDKSLVTFKLIACVYKFSLEIVNDYVLDDKWCNTIILNYYYEFILRNKSVMMYHIIA